MTENLEELRDKDRVILKHVSEGKDDTHKITQATTLEAHEVRYSLKKLEDLDLVTLEKPEGMVERVVNGQKRIFKAPLQAELADVERHPPLSTEEDLEGYENLSSSELVEVVQDHEQRIERVETAVQMLKQRFQQKL